MSRGLYQDPGAWVERFIKRLVADSPRNTLGLDSDEPAWDEPLVGLAAGDDPLWQACQDHIGEFLWTPQDIFNLTYPRHPAQPQELTVISWVLPQTKATRSENAGQTVYPSRRWAGARAAGEAFNVELRRILADTLKVQGVLAVAPLLSPLWGWRESAKHGFASNWSERHAAHIAGLGTFGLCDGLITPKGKAVRLGSVVARLEAPATPRPYEGIHDYCLFYSQGNCGKCIPRCPVGALSQEGHDKTACKRHVMGTCSAYIEKNYGFKVEACGLCQVAVPCMDHLPAREEGD